MSISRETSRSPLPLNNKFMRLAVEKASRGMRRREGGPFGAVVTRRGKVISASCNTVLRQDATCHAEVNAIRAASKRLGTYVLSDCEIYSTTEPCPMCFSAIHWARIKKIYFGTAIRDVSRLGFNEMPVSDKRLKQIGKSPVEIRGGVMRKECLKLLKDWEALEDKTLY